MNWSDRRRRRKDLPGICGVSNSESQKPVPRDLSAVSWIDQTRGEEEKTYNQEYRTAKARNLDLKIRQQYRELVRQEVKKRRLTWLAYAEYPTIRYLKIRQQDGSAGIHKEEGRLSEYLWPALRQVTKPKSKYLRHVSSMVNRWGWTKFCKNKYAQDVTTYPVLLFWWLFFIASESVSRQRKEW